MISFIVKTPLTKNEVSTTFLASLHHILEVVLFLLIQCLVVLGIGDVDCVFGFWFGWFEWASQNQDFGIFNNLLHLRVRHVLLHQYTVYHFGVLKASSSFSLDLDKFEIHILSANISNLKNCIDGDFGKLSLIFINNLRAQGYHGRVNQLLVTIGLYIDYISNLIKSFEGYITSFIETISYLKWMKSFVNQTKSLLQESTSKHDNSGGTISSFVILTLR